MIKPKAKVVRTTFLVYKGGLKGPRELKAALPEYRPLRVEFDSTTYKPWPNHRMVNWGCSKLPAFPLPEKLLNHPSKVATSTNKLKALGIMKEAGINVPEFTTDPATAAQWAVDGRTVVVRQTLTGHSGQGIVLFRGEGDIPSAPLYTRYRPKKDEYRVHVFRGKVIDVQQKKRRLDWAGDKKDTHVRNVANGYIFARDGVVLPETAAGMAISATAALGLDFGAVDIGVSKKGEPTVYECNSAPGIEGSTVGSYASAIREWLRNG